MRNIWIFLIAAAILPVFAPKTSWALASGGHEATPPTRAAGAFQVAQIQPNSEAYLQPLSQTEIDSANGCFIQATDSRYLIDKKVKISGALIPVTLSGVTMKSKTWTGKDLSISFQLTSGVLKEKKDGKFTPGVSAWGVLRIVYKGQRGDMRAREECVAP
jgi:hypothetical protein